jgi:hypothetical protein
LIVGSFAFAEEFPSDGRSGDYRITPAIDDQEREPNIPFIRHRKDIYRDLRGT